MLTVDLKKELKHLYRLSLKEITRVDVPHFQFLMIDGEGDPNDSRAYAEAVRALFTVFLHDHGVRLDSPFKQPGEPHSTEFRCEAHNHQETTK